MILALYIFRLYYFSIHVKICTASLSVEAHKEKGSSGRLYSLQFFVQMTTLKCSFASNFILFCF